MSLKEVLSAWEKDPHWRRRIRLWHREGPAGPRLLPWPDDVPQALKDLFQGQGVKALYSHQAKAWSLSQKGASFLLMTPTASGKSMAFHLPVLRLLLEDPRARVLYLYPMKALAQDQMARWHTWARELFPLEGSGMAALYDGDTPHALRPALRQRARVIFTNLPMMKRSLLDHPNLWEMFLTHLQAVVADEVHVYQGLLGGEAAYAFRRLWSLLREKGLPLPQILAASATLGNPHAFAHALFGRPLEIIAESGAPRPERHYLVAREAARPGTEARLWLRDLLEGGVAAIAFCPSRQAVEELVWSLGRLLPHRKDAIVAYRRGYTPEERRSLEEKLRRGEAQVVVATSALQLGIDIGSLDAALVVGEPPSVAAFHQAWGRAGRRGHPALAAWIPGIGGKGRYPRPPFSLPPESLWLPHPFFSEARDELSPPPLFFRGSLWGWDLEGRRPGDPYLHQGTPFRVEAAAKDGLTLGREEGVPLAWGNRAKQILAWTPLGEKPLGREALLRWGFVYLGADPRPAPLLALGSRRPLGWKRRPGPPPLRLAAALWHWPRLSPGEAPLLSLLADALLPLLPFYTGLSPEDLRLLPGENGLFFLFPGLSSPWEPFLRLSPFLLWTATQRLSHGGKRALLAFLSRQF